MKKIIFTCTMYIFAFCMGFSQTVKTVDISFSKDLFELEKTNNGRFLLTPAFDTDILKYSYEGADYINIGLWQPSFPLKKGNYQPCLLWRKLYLPLDETEGIASYSIEAREELLYENVLLDYCHLAIPTDFSSKKIGRAYINAGDDLVYSETLYPDSNIANIQLSGYGVFNGQTVEGRTLCFDMCPFRYDAEKRNLYLLTDIKLVITLKYDPTPTPPIPLLYDFDGDGILTLNDITTLINIYLDKYQQGINILYQQETADMYPYDLDGDGILTLNDITMLINIYLEKSK